MEMQVNSSLIRSEREKRAWSQDHLATLTGLARRTIQRIEAEGAASYESASAIAAVFGVPVAEIRVASKAKRRTNWISVWRKRVAAIGVASVACGASILLVRTAVAEQVMLDVGISWNDAEERTMRLLTEEGDEAEIRIEDVLTIVIVPTIRDDGSILLSARIFEISEGESKLLSEPRVATLKDNVAEIRQGSDSGRVYSFLITPSLQ